MKTPARILMAVVAAVSMLAHPRGAAALNSISIGSVSASPGDATVTVPIAIQSDVPLTLLNLLITFDPSLCDAIAGQAMARGPASRKDPEPGWEGCPGGTVHLVYFDLTGETVIPAGSGVIANWVVSLQPDAQPGDFPLHLTVVDGEKGARQGPLKYVFATGDGRLTIVGGANQEPGSAPAAGGMPANVPVAPPEARVGTPSDSAAKSAGAPVGGEAMPGVPAGSQPQALGTPENAAPTATVEEQAAATQPAGHPAASPPAGAAAAAASPSPLAGTATPASTPVHTATVGAATPTRTRPAPAPTATHAPASQGMCAMQPPHDGDRSALVLLMLPLVWMLRVVVNR